MECNHANHSFFFERHGKRKSKTIRIIAQNARIISPRSSMLHGGLVREAMSWQMVNDPFYSITTMEQVAKTTATVRDSVVVKGAASFAVDVVPPPLEHEVLS
jgi:hypothetical protein